MIATGIVTQNSGYSFIARIIGQNGQPITQASLASVTYTITDLGPYRNTPVSSGPTVVTISTTVFDSLQTVDPRWKLDSQFRPGDDGAFGYNFLLSLPPIASANQQQIDVRFTPVSGQPFNASGKWTPQQSFA